MGFYRVAFKASAVKELEKASPRETRQRIVDGIRRLEDDPRPPGSEKLSARDFFRLRRGDFRIVYAVDDARRAVLIVKIGHRREVSGKSIDSALNPAAPRGRPAPP